MVEARLAAWRGRGAARFDALRFGFVEALARRTAAHSGAATRAVLEARLMAALQAYGEHFDAAEAEATRLLTEATARFPAAGEALRQCHAAGDFGALRRQVAALQLAAAPRPWAELERAFGLDGAAAGLAKGSAKGLPETQPAGPAGPELKAATRFRKTWARLGAEKRLRESLAQAPGNAGPLNSHGLVLRSLQRMHAISPDYLSRWVAQVDALLWIEQAARAVGPDSLLARHPRAAPGRIRP